MTKEDNIIVPRWFLEVVEDTLRIQNNIDLDKKTGETCQDLNIKQSLNGVRKLLKGEELTGMERLEKLQPSLPYELDKAEKVVCADAAVCKLTNRAWVTPLNEKQFEADVFDNFVAGDKVIVQIRKK